MRTLYITWIKQKPAAYLREQGSQCPRCLKSKRMALYIVYAKAAHPVKPKFGNVTESQQFKRWFGDWQNHPESASKVVNKDGTPKIMYHGTPGKGFTVLIPTRLRMARLVRAFISPAQRSTQRGILFPTVSSAVPLSRLTLMRRTPI